MPAPRSADDKLLALLGRMPAPLEIADIARALNWSRQNARAVSLRLERAHRVTIVLGERAGGVGRPPQLVALPGGEPPARAPLPRLEPDTYVVTPTGQEARVVGMRARSFVEFEYVTGPERFTRSTLHVRLLRPFQPGRERPEPVRIARPSVNDEPERKAVA